MTCMQAAPARAGVEATPLTRGMMIAMQVWRAYWQWRARKATIRILHALDKRTLKDIGVDPSEIESLVYGRGERCRRYDEGWR